MMKCDFSACSKKSDPFFRTVIIPASLGDKAPDNGDYQNAIVKLEANNAVYIFGSDGIAIRLNPINN